MSFGLKHGVWHFSYSHGTGKPVGRTLCVLLMTLVMVWTLNLYKEPYFALWTNT